MGLGDNILATGLAKGAHARGKRVAFGDGKRICWDGNSEIIFRHNPNIAPPGSEGARDLEWNPFRKGNRLYNKHVGQRWVWNYEFKPVPGEMYFTADELISGQRFGKGFVLIEPNVPRQKSVAPNKDWGFDNYQTVADDLCADGHRIVQFSNGGPKLKGIEHIKAHDFRDALAILGNAALYVGPEGGLHHGAAAVGIPAVVLFGGFIPPQVTGYNMHTNLTGEVTDFCGSLKPCVHCRAAMQAIPPELVTQSARVYLQ